MTVVSGCTRDAEEAAPEEPTAPTAGVYGQAPDPVGGIPSIVTATPVEGVEPSPPGAAEIDQLGLQFNPTRLIVGVGDTVRFRNSESLTHNVQVNAVDGGRSLFSADTPPDEVAPFAFEEPGGYDITCEIHPGMRAVVFVTPAPHHTFAEEDGAFAMPDLAPGDYVLGVWSVDPDARTERSVVVRDGAATEVEARPGR